MESLPLVIYTLMLELAVGSFVIMMVTDFKGEVGGSFLVTGGLTALGSAIVARWVASSVSFNAGERVYPSDQNWASWQDTSLNITLGALVLYNLMIFLGTDPARRVVGVAAALACVMTLLFFALQYRGDYLGGWIAPFSMFAGAVSLGAVMTGMLLGHWYLVSPTMAVAPLARINEIFFWALLVQGGLVLVNVGPWASGNATAMWEKFAVFFWVRVLVGIVFPVVLAVMTRQTCKLKAHMSSTGFLYVALALVLAGEIVSRVILFSTGVPL
jgi:hypothetical protein